MGRGSNSATFADRVPSTRTGAGSGPCVWLSSVAEFKLVYAGSVLGYIWTLARPLAMFGVIYLVFSQVLEIGATISNYPAMLLINLLVFQFFSDAAARQSGRWSRTKACFERWSSHARWSRSR